MNNDKTDKLLEDIKKLLIFQIINNGTAARRIAELLKVDPAVISRMMPSKNKKK